MTILSTTLWRWRERGQGTVSVFESAGGGGKSYIPGSPDRFRALGSAPWDQTYARREARRGKAFVLCARVGIDCGQSLLRSGPAAAKVAVSDGLKTNETRRFENHCPQKLNLSSMQHRRVGCRSES